MDIQPLSKEIYAKALKFGIEEIHLQFSGGSDQGYLNVKLLPSSDYSFSTEVEEWAWEVYSYCGAGDGTDYGDNVVYDLKNKKVSTEEWFMEKSYQDGGKLKLKVV